MANYAVLFRVDICHDYFNDNRCRPMSFVVGNQSQKLIDNGELLFRCDLSGFSVLYDMEKTATLQALADDTADHEHGLQLNFQGILDDPQFGYYSKNSALNAGQRLAVIIDSQAIEEQTSNGKPRKLALTYIKQEDVNNHCQNEGFSRWLNNQFLIACGLTLNDLTQLLASDTPPVFQLQFETLQTRWQYYFVGNWLASIIDNEAAIDQSPNNHVLVVDEAEQVSFTPLKPVVLPGGQTAMTSTSDTALPLQQISQFHFSLTQGDSILIGHLPVANIFAQSRWQSQPISEIYVNQSKRIC